jgi:integrase
MSPLEVSLADYLRLRRALGHKMNDAERYLVRFVAYLDGTGRPTVTMAAVLAFVLDPDLDPASTVPARRASAVRGFARYLSGIDPATETPPAGIATYRKSQRRPFIFSDRDVNTVARSAAAASPFPFRRATLTTMIGLLAVSGLRVGEAINLDRADIDLDDGVILVRNTKFSKGRNVPVSASTIDALDVYRRQRDRTRPTSSRFFVSLIGTPVVYNSFAANFRHAVHRSGIAAGSAIQPRVHDLRHSFAVRTLLNWYRDGRDVEALLPRLSTYLGHAEPRHTYRYLTALPELLGQAANRLETSLADIW